MQLQLLQNIVIILGFAVVILLLFQKLKIPPIVGFLITGIIIGPSALSLVKMGEDVKVMAEIGIILLLFIIGIEFSIKTLLKLKKAVFIGGIFQVSLSILLTALFLYFFHFSIPSAIFTGFLISLSSTAIGLRLLGEKGEVASPHGKISLAILIFQDIIVVPMMLLTPMLTGEATNIGKTLLLLLLKGVFIIAFVYVSARFLVPKLLFIIAKTKSNELFLLSIVVICFSIAWLSSSLGLSLSIGAFLAGLTISESEYNQQATSNILPFREVFTSFFFISIGMLLNLHFLRTHYMVIIGLTLLVLFFKALIGTLASQLLGFPLRTSIIVGLILLQVGEFAFILSETGFSYHLIQQTQYQYFLSVSILSMTASPFIFKKAHAIAAFIGKKRKVNTLGKPKKQGKWEDHILIIGYGINGRNVAKAAQFAKIPYVIVELNAETVKKEKAKGEPIIYGDAVHPFILSHVNISKARVVVIAISDPGATKQIIASIRELTKNVYIIVRTRFLNEMEENFRLGANEVIPEEFETSIEIFTRVLHRYLVPESTTLAFVKEIRASNYQMLRPLEKAGIVKTQPMELPGIEISSIEVQKADSAITGVPLEEAQLRKNFDITIVAIKRKGEVLLHIDRNTKMHVGDLVFILGIKENINTFQKRITYDL